MRSLLLNLVFIIVVYSLLMNPALVFLGGKHTSVFVLPLLLLYAFPQIRHDLRYHKDLIVAWFFTFNFVLFRTVIGGEISFLVTNLMMLFETILVSFIIVTLAIKLRIDFVRILLIVASISGVISCLCLIFPEINAFSKSIQVVTNDYLETVTHRGFGIADGLTFSYSIVLGTICALGISCIVDYKWFIFFIPFISGAVLINARTGFIPIVISFILFVLSFRKIKYYFYLMFLVLVVFSLWINYIEELVPYETLSWVYDFFFQVGEGTSGGTLDTLLNTTAWPNDFIEWCIGKGYSVFEPKFGDRTDIGFLIQLCYGGVFYCFLLYFMVFVLVKKAYKKVPNILFLTLIFSMFFENFKGTFINRNTAFECFVMLMLYFTQLVFSRKTNMDHLAVGKTHVIN